MQQTPTEAGGGCYLYWHRGKQYRPSVRSKWVTICKEPRPAQSLINGRGAFVLYKSSRLGDRKSVGEEWSYPLYVIPWGSQGSAALLKQMPNSALRGIALANLKPQKCYPRWLGLAPHPFPLGVSGLIDPQVHASLKSDLMEVGFPERRGAQPPPHSALCCLHLAPEPPCWLRVLQSTCCHGTCWEGHKEGECCAIRRAHITSSYLEDGLFREVHQRTPMTLKGGEVPIWCHKCLLRNRGDKKLE